MTVFSVGFPRAAEGSEEEDTEWPSGRVGLGW